MISLGLRQFTTADRILESLMKFSQLNTRVFSFSGNRSINRTTIPSPSMADKGRQKSLPP